MMKKQRSKHKTPAADTITPTCGSCIHNPSGHRCSIFPEWAITPEDHADHCEYYFPRVPKKFLKYYKHIPIMTRGWPKEDATRFMEYIRDVKQGIITDNNGGYFARWPLGSKICTT